MTSDPYEMIRQRIREDAIAEGFGDIAFTPAVADPHLASRLDRFIAEGRHGSMAWMAETRERRIAPTAMWAEAKTAIVMVMNYGPDHDPMDNLAASDCGNISGFMPAVRIIMMSLKASSSKLLAVSHLGKRSG